MVVELMYVIPAKSFIYHTNTENRAKGILTENLHICPQESELVRSHNRRTEYEARLSLNSPLE